MKPRLSIISTLFDAIRLGRQHGRLVLALSIFATIPVVILTALELAIFAHMMPDTGNNPHHLPNTSSIAFYVAMSGVLATGMIGTQVSIDVFISAIILGALKTGPPVGSIWSTAKESIGRYGLSLLILIVLLSIIAILITAPITILIAVFGFSSIRNGSPPEAQSDFIEFMVMLGAVLYLVFVKYALARPVVVIEELKPLAALSRSWQMTRGRFWYVLGSYVFVGTAEYFIDDLFQTYESVTSFTLLRGLDLFFTSAMQCYWILLGWCMYWKIKSADVPPFTGFPPASPSGPQSA